MPNQVLNLTLPRGDQGPPGSVADGDKGDVTVSAGGTVWEINAGAVGETELGADVVSNAKLVNMATGTVKARATAGTGDPEDLTAAEVYAIIASVAGIPEPQGRLTLASGVAVPTSVIGATMIYFTSYVGDTIPCRVGSLWVMDHFTEMSLAGDTSHAANTNYDIFYFDDSGTPRIGTGPAWSTANSRGTGAGTTELASLGGLPVNANAMTVRNGSSTYSIAANAGIYLGTARTTASAGAFEDSAGGSNTIARRFLWNAFNRAPRHVQVIASASSWSYATAT